MLSNIIKLINNTFYKRSVHYFFFPLVDFVSAAGDDKFFHCSFVVLVFSDINKKKKKLLQINIYKLAHNVGEYHTNPVIMKIQ
jgi:hypothetical protein